MLDDLYVEILEILENKLGKGESYISGKFEGLGWLNFPYKGGLLPKISLKQQKNAVHLYIMKWIDGKPVLDRYRHIFGKSATGVGCIRIKKLDSDRKQALIDIIDICLK